jgi:hypothetical protein
VGQRGEGKEWGWGGGEALKAGMGGPLYMATGTANCNQVGRYRFVLGHQWDVKLSG